MKNSIKIILLLVMMTSYAAQAHNCGKVEGRKISTYGNLSCAKAIEVYKSFNRGKIPKGWTCGQSVGGCGIETGFTFH